MVRHTKCHCSSFGERPVVTEGDWAVLLLPFAWRNSAYSPTDPVTGSKPTSNILWLIKIWRGGRLQGSFSAVSTGANQTQSVCSPLFVTPTSSVIFEASATHIGAEDPRGALHSQMMSSAIAA